MIIDSRTEFSATQALTVTAVSTNVIDLGQDRDIGPGRQMWIVVVFKVALAGTTPTFQAQLQTDDNVGFATPTVSASGEQLSAAVAGKKQVIGMPYTNERYLRMNYVLGGTTPTATVAAWLTDQEPESWQSLPDGI